jgi:hypothetical protein
MDFVLEIVASFFGLLVATGSVLMLVDRRVNKAKREKK